MVTMTGAPLELTLAHLHHRFGDIPFHRIRQNPAPGTATIADVTRILDHENRPYELVDGVLVEKTVGAYESLLALLIAQFLGDFVRSHKLGVILGADGTLEIAPALVRIPDVSFISWDRLPNRRFPREPVPRLVPDLAVEVLSKSNSMREMDEKLEDYFAAGVRLVWFVEPLNQTVRVFTGRNESRVLRETEILDGGAVLPGLALPIREIFATPIEDEARPAPRKPG